MRRVGRARLNAPDSKSDIGVSLSGVRIPHSPPFPYFRKYQDRCRSGLTIWSAHNGPKLVQMHEREWLDRGDGHKYAVKIAQRYRSIFEFGSDAVANQHGI